MKVSHLIGIAFVLLLGIGCYRSCKKAERKVMRENYNALLGSYVIDLERTDLRTYKKDSALYADLTITYNEDSTFHLSKKVPFIYDSAGTWMAAKPGFEEWNWMYFNNSQIDIQFTSPWTDESIIYLNSVTPQKGQEPVYKIYFKKVFD